MKIPYLKHDGNADKLFVHEKPFLVLGGEIHNSSSSSLEYMEKEVWPHVRPLGLNTLIAPVFWELLEPEENEYHFELVEGLIDQARRERVKLVLLWFGLWKNGMSTYTPAWVKQNPAYFRMRDKFGKPVNAVSPFCDAAVEKDAAAFAELMSFLKRYDGKEHTVIMVQVENEMGLLGSDRDFSSEAERRFMEEIPQEVAKLYACQGTWESLEEEAPELFMAYHYAAATERIAAAGAAVYPLPLYVNAWLEHYADRPGDYPSGGPVAKVMQVWKKTAPTLKLFAPDIYVKDFEAVSGEYSAHDNPLFIPEARASKDSAANVFLAIGGFDAVGFAPFAIEDLNRDEPRGLDIDPVLLAELNIDMSAFDSRGAGKYLARSYVLIGGMSELILSAQGTGRMWGFTQNEENVELLTYPDYDIRIKYKARKADGSKAGGLVIRTEDGAFWLTGMNYSATFLPKKGERKEVDFLSIEEGVFEDGKWKAGRRLNGDEYYAGFDEWGKVLLCKVYKYDG